MDGDRGPWADGRRAWRRLTLWRARSGTDHPHAGDAALDAMADIGLLRRLLDQAELAAVRAARRHNRSWAEIATQLGVTRQSAWERWRELDDSPASEEEPVPVEADVIAEARRRRNRTRKVVVPNVIGMSYDDARTTLQDRGLDAISHDPDGPSLAALGWPNTVVVDQIPESGAKVPAGTQIRLWLERGGGSAGVREPRRPSPEPKGGLEWYDEPESDTSAVG